MPRVCRLLAILGHEIPERTEAIASFHQFRIEPARRFGGKYYFLKHSQFNQSL